VVPGAKPIPLPENAASTPESAYAFGSLTKPGARTRPAGLLDGPLVPLNAFRKFTQRAGPLVTFFKQLGYDVTSSESYSVSATGGVVQNLESSQQKKAFAYLIDVFVSTARAGYKVTVSTGAYPVTAIEYQVQYDDSSLGLYGVRARLMTGEMPKKPSSAELIAARQAGQSIQDDGMDHLKLATIYVLKTGEDGALNGVNEVAFMQHHCFWNLEHMARNRAPVNIRSQNLGMTALALTGRYTIAPAATLSAVESSMNEALAAALNAGSNEGRYWSV
jgi:hypothetical protein